MRCPFCRVDNDKVIDSRASQDGFAIRRRRECAACKRRYTTYEKLEEPALKVVKKDGLRMPFEREKIKRGLEKALYKRPVSDEQIESLVSAVENDVLAESDNEVETRRLGELVMQRLRDLDQVAYVRFASVYREFKDVRDFVEELEPILAQADFAPRRPLPAAETPPTE
jgi:transcriptional repressor NrdR